MEEVILALCLFAVLDLCSLHPLSLAVKYPVLAPSPADGCKASCGTGTFTDSNEFAFACSQFGGFYTRGSVKLGPRLCSRLQLWWGGSSQPVSFGGRFWVSLHCKELFLHSIKVSQASGLKKGHCWLAGSFHARFSGASLSCGLC